MNLSHLHFQLTSFQKRLVDCLSKSQVAPYDQALGKLDLKSANLLELIESLMLLS